MKYNIINKERMDIYIILIIDFKLKFNLIVHQINLISISLLIVFFIIDWNSIWQIGKILESPNAWWSLC